MPNDGPSTMSEAAAVTAEEQSTAWWHDADRLREARKAAHDRLTGTDWGARERALNDQTAAQLQRERQEQAERKEMQEFHAHCKQRWEQTGDRIWWKAAEAIGRGEWLHAKVINSDLGPMG